jgi:trans-aconitate methyltransferase
MNLQTLIPKSVRHRIHGLIGPKIYERLRYRYYMAFRPNAGYDAGYYQNIDDSNRDHFDLLAKTLIKVFKPQTVVDVGCGSGGIGQALLAHGAGAVHGFDFSSDSITVAQAKLTSARQLDVTKAEAIPATGDLCLCTEVAEHLPPKFGPHLVNLLARVAPAVVFTAAHPGQGGHLHVNLRPRDYWIELFEQAGLRYNSGAVEAMRTMYEGRMNQDYDVNLMVFCRS